MVESSSTADFFLTQATTRCRAPAGERPTTTRAQPSRCTRDIATQPNSKHTAAKKEQAIPAGSCWSPEQQRANA
eukprot:1080290-Alexandrium_andersonii.AAC.1